MGCWNETCFVTRTPIFQGDKVAMVVLALDFPASALIDFSMFRFQKAIETIEFGTYNDYGWIEEVDGATSKDMHLRMKARKPEPYERALFVHQKVWDRILAIPDKDSPYDFYKRVLVSAEQEREMSKLGINLETETEEQWEKKKKLLRVMCFCHDCRIDPACGLAFKGSQGADLEAYQELRKLEGLVLASWKRKQKAWDEDDEPAEEKMAET